jgi:hypothetical protein
MENIKLRRAASILGFILATAMVAGLPAIPNSLAQDTSTGATSIPSGTILPVRLNSSLSSARTQPNQIVSTRIMQDVPLPNGMKIREGSKVLGHVVDVSSPDDGNAEKISLQFDRLIFSGQTIPIRTQLRAVAGLAAVMDTRTPDGPASNPTSTTQVGGEVVYTSGGPVTTTSGVVVGKSVDGGVQAEPRPGSRQGKECEGVVDGNNRPEALWVFSSDACGTYSLPQIRIAHAGKTDPVGIIVLVSEKGQLKLPRGSGMLLRVQ